MNWITSMRLLVALLSSLMVPFSGAAASPCSGPTGLYHSLINKADGTVFLDITLNLLCDNGSYNAQLFTSMGDFKVTSAEGSENRVKIEFDSGASLGDLTLAENADILSGHFTFGEDRGAIRFVRSGVALAADAMTPRLDLTPTQWREDIAFYAKELPKLHANAYFHITRDQFDAEVRALDARAGNATGDEMLVGLQAITKSIGDGHTGIFAIGIDRRVMPIAFGKFENDVRIVSASTAYQRLLGMRLVKIGGMPITDAWTKIMTLTPQAELEQLRRQDALVYLARGYALHGLGIISDRNQADYTVQDDNGKTSDVDVIALAPGEHPEMKSVFPDKAIRLQNKDSAFWCKALEEQQAVYCDWRGYQDLGKNAKAMFALLAAKKPSKLILDMRDNGGGDNTVGDAEIVKPLIASTHFNRKGRLYVLIGAETFSAAMNNAAQLQDQTNAILVGETIGEKPNSYQEPRQFRLPNSHLIVRASTLWYAFRKNGPNVVAPNKEIIPTWDDSKSGRDKVLEWALAQPVN